MGNGFQEVVYRRALSVEFSLQGLSFLRELEMPLVYKGEFVGTRRVDFFVKDLVMAELKAIENLEGVHKAQAINYCEAYNIADGLLINLGSERLKYHRLFNKNLKSNKS